VDEELARDPEHGPGLELLDDLEGDVAVVVSEEQGAEAHHEVEDLVSVDIVDVAAVPVVREKRVRSEVADVAFDPSGGESRRPAPELGALLVPRDVLPAELLGRQWITSRRKRGRRRADFGTPGPLGEDVPRRGVASIGPVNVLHPDIPE